MKRPAASLNGESIGLRTRRLQVRALLAVTNKCKAANFATLADLERAVADRCRVLEGDQLSLGTNFHWWPKPATPS